jgi:prevent-host-death family protein
MSTHSHPRDHALLKAARGAADGALAAVPRIPDVIFSRRHRPPTTADLRRARDGERVRLYQHGKAVAAVISIDDLELLERFEMARDVRDYDASKAEGGESLTSDEMRAELGLSG